MQFWTLDEIEHHAMADHEVGEEIAPGVTITRRRILQVGLASAAGLLAAGCTGPGEKAAPATSPEEDALTIEQLLARVRPEARRMIASDRPDEAAYLAAVSSLLARYQPTALADYRRYLLLLVRWLAQQHQRMPGREFRVG